ncbi:MAG: hypothetical protein LC664_02875 [Flavobacteriales bacterium]|nr:hypothetical protein [Flavobacteriales bacterium]
MKFKSLFTAILLLVASISWAQNDNCTGTLTDNVEVDGGTPFVNGYTYYFYTVGDEVTATFTLLDEVDGLVAFYQTLNPEFEESGPFFPEPGTQTVTASFPGFSDGEAFSMRIKFSFAGGFSTGDTLTYTVGDNCGIEPPQPLELPIDFESTAVDYSFDNFAGGVSTVVPNPDPSGENTSETVAEMVKEPGDVFGGSTLALDDPIDFSENKLFQMKVRSPRVGARVLLKVENALNPGIFFEKEDTSTVANEWETLSFDFNAINTADEYSKITLIWDNGEVGDGSDNFTFQYDEIELVMGGMEVQQVALPITFEDGTLDYGLTDFAGNISSLVTDPEDTENTVVQTVRGEGSATFAGTTVGQPSGLEDPIPFDFDNTGMSVRVWSPEVGIPVRLKVEQVGAPGIFAEVETLTTVAGAWETVEFNFAQAVNGGLNLDLDYNLVTIFFNFDADPATTPEQTYFWDDVDFAPGVGGFVPVELPIDFDTPGVTFGLTDFGGNVSTIIPDPEDAGNNVVQSIRTEGATFFAGTTVPSGGLTDRIPFQEGSTTMSVRVWSPEVGVPVRMKLESTDSPGLVAEKEIPTTTSGEWETIEFDFSVDALVAVDVNADYNIVSLFFNFNPEQEDPAPEQIYLWDDIAFLEDSEGAVVDGSVNWNSSCDDRAAELDLYEAGTANFVASYDVIVDTDGNFSVAVSETGSHDLYLKVEGYLSKVQNGVVLSAGANAANFGTITPGDLTGNNAIGIGDFSGISSAYGTDEGDPGFNVLADFNCDETINIQDYSSFSSNYGSVGDQNDL